MFCLSHNVERKPILGAKFAHAAAKQKPSWNISKKVFTTKACLVDLYANTGQKDYLDLVICELIATPAIRVVLNGKVRHMKTNNNKAYIFGQRKEGTKENVLSQERLDTIKQMMKGLRTASAETLQPACPKCTNLEKCLGNALNSDLAVKCVWYGWLLENKKSVGG